MMLWNITFSSRSSTQWLKTIFKKKTLVRIQMLSMQAVYNFQKPRKPYPFSDKP